MNSPILNWQIISTSFPIAFKELNDWYGEGLLELKHDDPKRFGHYYTNGIDETILYDDFVVRDLYDFFDDLGFYITIESEYDYDRSEMENCLQDDWTQCKNLLGFRWGIYQASNSYVNCTHVYEGLDQRAECEQDAFMKAFEILNTRPVIIKK